MIILECPQFPGHPIGVGSLAQTRSLWCHMRRLCTFFQKPINVTASSHSSERNEIDGEGEHGAQQTYLLFTALSTTFTEMQASAFEMNKLLQKDTR